MSPSRAEVLENIAKIRHGIERASLKTGRSPKDVRIVAAAKMVPTEAIEWAVQDGVGDIGHNYVRELRDSCQAIQGARCHFIGTLQSGTVRHVAATAEVVQSLASRIATEKLARRAAELGRTIDSLIQVDFTGSRTGVRPDSLDAFADIVEGLDGLRLVGLMTLHPVPRRPEDARPHFARLRELVGALAEGHPGVVETSMGMSFDYEVAVEEGATMVRIGTALFGPREQPR